MSLAHNVWKKLRPWVARLLVVAAAVFIACIPIELYLRSQIAAPFVTVAQTSEVEGLPYQLRPEFSTLYYGNRVDINRHGFRGPDVSAKKEGCSRIALLGDSYTFGHVALEDTLAVILAARLKEFGEETEVLNCGVPGYDANNLAIMLEKQVLELAPDVVIYMFCYNDTPPPGPTPRPIISPDKVIDPVSEFPLRSALLQLTGVTIKAGMRNLGFTSSQGSIADDLNNFQNGGAERLKEAVIKMRDLCQANNLPFRVVSCPFLVSAKFNPWKHVEEEIQKFCADHSIPFIDLRGAFSPDDNLTNYHRSLFDGHPDGKANKQMASFLAEKIKK